MVIMVNFILVLWLSTVQYVTSKVTWSMLNKTVSIGNDVTLYCNGSTLTNCTNPCTRRWFGGPDQRLIAMNEVSSFPQKYASHVTDDGFYLHIKHLEDRDLNVSYTCTVRFDTFKQMLHVEEDITDQSTKIFGSITTTLRSESGTTVSKRKESQDERRQKSNKTAIIVGVIIGIIEFIAIVVIVICFVRRKKRGSKSKENGELPVRKSDIEANYEEIKELLSNSEGQCEKENKYKRNGHIITENISGEQDELLSNSEGQHEKENKHERNGHIITENISGEQDNDADDATGNTLVKTTGDSGNSGSPPEHVTNAHTHLKSSQEQDIQNGEPPGRKATIKGDKENVAGNTKVHMVQDSGNSEDLVRCFHCAGAVSDWHENDNPWIAHARWFPKCGYLLKTNGREFIDMVQKTHKNDRCPGDQKGAPTDNNSTEDISINIRAPKYPEFESKSKRLCTLESWPQNKIIDSDVVAEAGFFYYLKSIDEVHCFWCGNGLADWKENEDPWVEHQNFFKFECGFVHSNEFTDAHNNYLGIETRDNLAKPTVETPKWKSLEKTDNGPLFPKYADLESRLTTFKDWSSHLVQKPYDLARAGFFVKEKDIDVLDNYKLVNG